ncbi:MAG: gamma-glutamyltransferase, partial [Planctomycetales bacterium]|nr:gamma-glutamyltransferase [Planctomycetales bacterium]
MFVRWTPRLTLLVLIFLVADGGRGAGSPAASGRQAMVATVQPLATEAGVAALRAGGNAVDAAVAAALTLGVVDGHNSGIGGGCFMVLRLADGRIVALDGRETAPGRAHRDMYLRDGQAQPQLSQTGPLAVATPGALAAYAFAVENFGNCPLADLLEGAAEIAERGFPLDAVYAARLQAQRKTLARFEGSRAVLLQPDGRPYPVGHTLRQPDLAATYRAIARHGTGWFYGGPFAERVERWMRDHGGLLTAEDFRQYQVKLRTPL